MITYIEGDLFAAIKDKKTPVVLPHICNCDYGWGAGFVVPLGKHFPAAKDHYLNSLLRLGDVGFIVKGNILICNMIAQELGGKRPIFYNHLANCMDKVAKVLPNGCEIHCPAFGSALAGGDFHNVIRPLIEDCWIRPFENPPPIFVYYLPGTFLPPVGSKHVENNIA